MRTRRRDPGRDLDESTRPGTRAALESNRITGPATFSAARDGDLGARAANAHALQGTAGNAAVQRLVEAGGAPASISTTHQEGLPSIRAGWSDDEEDAASAPEPSSGEAPEATSEAVGGVVDEGGEQAEGLGSAFDEQAGGTVTPLGELGATLEGDATQLGTGTPGTSSTKVGPPSNSTYSVSGDLDAVAATVNGRKEAGSVSTAIASQDFDVASEGAPNEKVVAARLVISQVMELPVWTDKSNAPAKMQAEWDRFSAALAAHEAGHVQKDVTGFAGAHAKALGKNKVDANAAIDTVETTTTTANDTYDTETDHGRNKGTRLQTNLGQVIKVP